MAVNREEQRTLDRITEQPRLAISGRDDASTSASDVGGLAASYGGLSLATPDVEEGGFRLPAGLGGLTGNNQDGNGGGAPAGNTVVCGGGAINGEWVWNWRGGHARIELNVWGGVWDVGWNRRRRMGPKVMVRGEYEGSGGPPGPIG